MKEGVIRFDCRWTREAIEMDPGLLQEINRWRSRLRELDLIGVLPGGVGFGNLSARYERPGQPGSFGDPESVLGREASARDRR